MSIGDIKPIDAPSLFLVSAIWLFAMGHWIAGTVQFVIFVLAVWA